MNLVGKKGSLKDGRKFIVVEYTAGSVSVDAEKVSDMITLNIEGCKSDRVLFNCLKSGYLTFDDPTVTEEVLSYYDEIIKLEKEQVEDANKDYIVRNSNKVKQSNRLINLPGLSKNYRKYMDYSKCYLYSDVEKMHDIQIRYAGNGINVKLNEIILISHIDKVNGRLTHGDDFADNGNFIYCGQDEKTNHRAPNNNNEVFNSNKTNKKLHLYIYAASDEYYYQGEFKLVNEFIDSNGKRKFELEKL